MLRTAGLATQGQSSLIRPIFMTNWSWAGDFIGSNRGSLKCSQISVTDDRSGVNISDELLGLCICHSRRMSYSRPFIRSDLHWKSLISDHSLFISEKGQVFVVCGDVDLARHTDQDSEDHDEHQPTRV